MSDRSDAPHQMQALSVLGLVTLGMTLLGWSSVPLFLKHFADSMDAWAANGWRYGFSALLWLPVIVHQYLRGTLPRGIWRAAVPASVLNITGQAAFAWAPYFIDPGLMTFGLRTQLIFVAIGAYLMFPSERRVLRSASFLGALVVVFLGAMGTLVLAQMRARGADPGPAGAGVVPMLVGHQLTRVQSTVFGIALSVVSGALFAGYALAVRKRMHGVHPVTAFATICQYTGLGMVTMMVVLSPEAGWYVTRLEGRELGLLALSAVIGIALGHVFYYTSIARLGVALSSGVIQLQPIIVGVASYFMFGEVLSTGQWVCGLLAVGAAMVMLGTQHRMGKSDAAALRAHGAGEPAPAAAASGGRVSR